MAEHKPFDPKDHIPANWGMASNNANEIRGRSRALVWIAAGLSIPAAAVVCLMFFMRTDSIEVSRDAEQFEKNLKVAAPSSVSTDPLYKPDDSAAKDAPPKGMVKMNYTTDNVKMELYRKEGYAVAEKKKKKDDFLGNPLNETGTTDVDDRAKGPGGPDK